MSTADVAPHPPPGRAPDAPPVRASDAPPVRASDAPPVRASDAEREDTVTRLHAALAEGRLDLAEIETRVAAAYAARHTAELPPLLADLPPSSGPLPHPDARAPGWAAVWLTAVWWIRSLVLGPAGAERPTPAACRTAARLAAAALVWFGVCVILGAVVVGS